MKSLSKTDLLQVIRKILEDAASAAIALRGMYETHKAQNSKFSMQYLCRIMGIPSTGYLSDVMNGKRILSSKYHSAVAKAFQLKAPEARIVKLLLALDTASADEAHELRHKLTASRKALNVTLMTMTESAEDLFLALDVYSSFGLFHGRVTIQKLKKVFAQHRPEQLANALQLLLQRGLVAQEKDQSFSLVSSQTIFQSQKDPSLPVKFIRQGLTDADKNLETWFADGEKSFFTSQIVSVRMKDYMRDLHHFKTLTEEHLSSIESNDGNALIRFNIQVYPAYHS